MNIVIRYEIIEPISGKRKFTFLKAKAIRHWKKGAMIIERRLFEIQVNEWETYTLLHQKEWRPKS